MVQWSIKRCPLFRLGVLSHFHKWWAFLPALHGRLCHRPGAQKQSKSPPYPLPRLEVSGCLASVMRPWSWRTWVFPTSSVGDSSEWSMGWSYSDQHKDQTCKLFTKSLWVSLVEVQNMFEVTLSLYCWRVIRFFSTHIIVLWTSPNTVIRHLPLPFKKSRWSQCLVQSVCHRCPYSTLLQCWSVYFPMSCFETAKELFLHSAQGGTTAPGDVTNAVARHLDATHPIVVPWKCCCIPQHLGGASAKGRSHPGLNQKSEELSTGHEQHLSSVSEEREGHQDTTNHWQNLSWQIHWSIGSCFRTNWTQR